MQKFGRLVVLFCLIYLCLFELPAIGQSKKLFVITGKLVPEAVSSGTGSIEMLKSGAASTIIEIPKNGRFRLELEYFNEYTLTFMFPGHFSKTLIVSTDIPQEVWKRDHDFPPFPMIVKLFRETEGIDKSFTLKPSGKIFYGKQTDNFEKEIIFNDTQIAEQIAAATIQSGEVKKEVQTITKQEAQDLATRQKNFDQAIIEADVLFKRGEYPMALLKYQEAQKLFPEKAYPNDRIAELQDLVKALEITEKQKAEIEERYKSAIARASGFFDQKTYKEARAGYQEALVIKPGDVISNGRIQEIDQLLAQIEKQKQFDGLITQADQSFNKKDYASAQADYRKALTIIADETYPASRIKEIDQILEKEQQAKALDDHYKSVIANADKSFDSESYEDALKIYTEALTIKPNEEYPTGRIRKINVLLAEKAKLLQTETEFQALVAKGDASFNQKEYEASKTQYTSALELKSNSADVISKIKNIDSILQKLADDQKKEKENRLLALSTAIDKTYNEAITKGNKQIEQKTYPEARITFQEARKLKSTELLPDEMIAKIDALIATTERELAARLKEEANQNLRQEVQDNSFNEAMNKADKAFTDSDFNTAKTGYQTALTIKNTDPTAKDKLAQTEAKLAQLAKLTQDYNTAINVANKHVGDKQYKEAKSKYQEALQYLPDSDYPKRQIEKLDELLLQAVAEHQKEELYASAIKEGEAMFANKNYSGARLPFIKASELKPSEPLPVQRIRKIDKLLADLALEEAKNKSIESGYLESIKRADQAFADKEYTSARLIYGESLSVKPTEQYPASRIAEIDKLLADLKLQQYNQAIAAADVAFKSDQLNEATTQYELALTSKANDEYAKKQLGEITKRRTLLLAEKAGLEKLDAQYKTLMAGANSNFNNKEYQKAKEKYQNALSLKPLEALPKEQILKIDRLLKELATAEEINRLYAESVKTAQEAFRQNKLKEARDAYQKAYNYKPAETMPPLRIAELDTMIAQLEETAKLNAMEDAQRLTKEKANKEEYDTAIAAADEAFKAKQYSMARTNYSNALSMLPNEKYPKDQISKIDGLIAQQEKINLLAKQQAMKDSIMKVRDEAFNLALSSAKELEQSKQYQRAILKYKEAIDLNVKEKTKLQKLIAAIEEKISLTEIPQEVTQTESVVTAPVETIKAPQTNLQAHQPGNNYDEAIKKADDSFGVKDYTVARFYYYKAVELQPKEEYPKNQIELIRKLVDSELSSVDRSGYLQAITQADDAFKKESYTVARFFYYKGLAIKSWEKYPKDRIQEILALTNSLLSEKEEKAYKDLIAKADEAFIGKDISIARFYYNKAIEIKRDEDYPRIKINDIQKLIDQTKLDGRNLEYNKLIEQADQAMKSESLSIARFNYIKALNMKPDEKYPKEQLQRIKEALNKLKG